jgi:membrane protein YqaA with SNARE-associated domain
MRVHNILFTLLSSVAGACLIAALDSTMIFFLPLAVDIGVIFITSRHPDLFWLFPIIISACSIVGASATFYLGGRLGEAGLERFISSRRLKKVKARLQGNRAVVIAALDLLPPPFPFTAFTLTAGALKVNSLRFFIAMFFFRLIRFGSEAALAALYGRGILRWMQSDAFRYVAYFFKAVVLAGSVVTIVQFFRKTRRRHITKQVDEAA